MGHYRLTAGLPERLQGHFDDPRTSADSKNSHGNSYYMLGRFTEAIDLFEQALAITQETGDRMARPAAWATSPTATRARPDLPGHRAG